MKDWYSPGSILPDHREVNIRPPQLEWIIEHYEVLSSGRWPLKSSGYTDNPFARQKGIKARAYFEDPAAVMAELHTRIDQCGRDGTAFLCCRCLNYDKIYICYLMRMNQEKLERILSDVFRYVAGRRKYRLYREFIQHKHSDFHA